MATRKYEQRLRAKSAEQTRRRILDALEEQLRAAPSKPVSVDAVARAAEVSRSTVYLVFGSRAGLFDAFARDVMERGGWRRLVEATQHPDPRETIRRGIRAGIEMLAANREPIRALFSMAALDADAVGGAIQRIEANRTEGMATLARRLAEQGALREDVSEADAAH